MKCDRAENIDCTSFSMGLPGLKLVGLVTHPNVNNGTPLSLFEPVQKETAETWNAAVLIQDRRNFFVVHGRDPQNDAEVAAWKKEYSEKDRKQVQYESNNQLQI